MTNDTIIISLTSYPARIYGVYDVLSSLLNQSVDKNEYHIVFTLAEPEFPNKEKDLPENLVNLINDNDIEMIWYPRNIRSHKKLIPALKKYPDNPILIIDDDVVRKDGWLEMFINDHKKYPNDIIGGSFAYYFDKDFKWKRFIGKKRKQVNTANDVPGILLRNARPANGLGGVLYPPHTFTDPRFFDEDLMMKISPTSDESWQYCFNVIEKRIMRQSSIVFDPSESFIAGSQQIPTSLHKVNNYEKITESLHKEFPEYKETLTKEMKKVVVSMTSYTKRMESGATFKALSSIMEQTMKPYRIVLVLHTDDIPNITKDIKKLIDNGDVELIEAEEDLRPHNKYFYAMRKYRYYPVILVDDDVVYAKDTVESLWKGYMDNPNCVSARRVHKIKRTYTGSIAKYSQWHKAYTAETDPSSELFVTNVGGAIYPPDVFRLSDENVEEIKKYITADDVYLYLLENRFGIKVVYIPPKENDIPINDDKTIENALWKINNNGMNDEYLKLAGVNVVNTTNGYPIHGDFSVAPLWNVSKKERQNRIIVKKYR